MNLNAKCKVCGVALTLEIDDAYMALGDPFNLLPLATCNRCYDFRISRQHLEGKILRQCQRVEQLSSVKRGPVKEQDDSGRDLPAQDYLPAETREDIKSNLLALTRRYATLICQHYHKRVVVDQTIVATLMDQPQNADLALRAYARSILTPAIPPTQPQLPAPPPRQYKDADLI